MAELVLPARGWEQKENRMYPAITREVVATVRVIVTIDEDNWNDEEAQIQDYLNQFVSDVVSIESVS
jgi:hypothetical protein